MRVGIISIEEGIISMTTLTAITAGAACIAAIAACLSAHRTRQATQAQIMSALLDQFGSEEIQQAHHCVVEFWTEHGDQRLAEFETLPPKVDLARRRIALYFDKVHRLNRARLINQKFVEGVAERDSIFFYLKKIEPLENIVNRDYDKSAFEYFAKLFQLERHVGR